MKLRWIRTKPGREENARAAGVALGLAAAVAAVVFYFARILISRRALPPRPERPVRGPGARGPDGGA